MVYENDRNKRRIAKIITHPDGTTSTTRYGWDCRDRLRRIILPDGRELELSYDAFSRRIQKRIVSPAPPIERSLQQIYGGERLAPQPSTTTRFLWDGDVLCAEITNDTLTRTHVHEPGSFVPLLQSEAGTTYAVITDHVGTPKELVDAQGRIAWSAAHAAWGNITNITRDETAAAVASPFRLLGQYHDEETGLCYTRHRYFDPEAGRWCSPDPLGIVGGKNLAGFNASPTYAVDLLGLSCKLRNIGPNTWESPYGLIYGLDPSEQFRTRVQHVLSHTRDIPDRSVPHGVFDSGRKGAIGLVDEAWLLRDCPEVTTKTQGATTLYTVPTYERVGWVGGQPGGAAGNPPAEHIVLVVKNGNWVVTAYPKRMES